MALVQITLEAQAQFDALPKVVGARMEKVLVRLEKWPKVSGAKPLRGALAGHFRIRTGDYRLQFRVVVGDRLKQPPVPDVVWVEKVGHRDGFYDE
jgi:mRNA-degrading endonuclease RelE of RelBE toxin-antitoxin system